MNKSSTHSSQTNYLLSPRSNHRDSIFNLSIMKVFALLMAGASLLATSNAYVVLMYPEPNCEGEPVRRNVWDNTCAYTKGFQSLSVVHLGGDFQQLKAYARQACAGGTTFETCAAGINSVELDGCHNTDGGSNALSSYSNGAYCPN